MASVWSRQRLFDRFFYAKHDTFLKGRKIDKHIDKNIEQTEAIMASSSAGRGAWTVTRTSPWTAPERDVERSDDCGDGATSRRRRRWQAARMQHCGTTLGRACRQAGPTMAAGYFLAPFEDAATAGSSP
ncbi:hypothetical protein MTO96_004989 [Rhipicephalus appendiculatus]